MAFLRADDHDPDRVRKALVEIAARAQRAAEDLGLVMKVDGEEEVGDER